MNRKTLNLIVILLALSLVLFACGPEETEPALTTQSAVNQTTPASTKETGYEGLGLTEDEIKLLEERGVANVDSGEVASKIAGFEVAEPSYIPLGFQPGKFMINISGAGLPAGMASKFNNTKVQRVYTKPEDKDVFITLIQSPQKLSVGGGEPVEICGTQGERAFSKADPANRQPYDKLTIAWEKDSIYYALTGTLAGTLGEAEMEKIACSIGTNELKNGK